MNNFVNGTVERIPVESMDYNKPVFETEQLFIENIAAFAKALSNKIEKPFGLNVDRRGNTFIFDILCVYGRELVVVQRFAISYNKFKQAEWVKLA